MPEYLYLIGCDENQTVKIGRTRDLKVRLGAIQRMSPVKVKVLWHVEGNAALESRLHRTFSGRRTHGEWFDFTGADPVALVRAAHADEGWQDDVLPSAPPRAIRSRNARTARSGDTHFPWRMVDRPDGVPIRLRALRAQAKLSGKALANAHGWDQSKVSRLETGKQMPSPEDIEAWARTCAASPETIKELLGEQANVLTAHATSRMRHGQAKVQEDYNELVRTSHLIRHLETVFIPGLLQVPDYARRVFTEMKELHRPGVDDVEAAVETRMQRQQMLYDPAKNFEFLLAEPVLRWLLCPPALMRSQLDRLQTVIGLDRIRFGIIPMGTELATTPQNSAQIYVGREPVVAVETLIGETFHRGEEAERYGAAFDQLWNEAVTGERARELVIAAMQALPAQQEREPQ